MTVARRFLADRRRSFLWWSLGMLLTVGLTVALWPSVRGQAEFEDPMRDLPPAVQALFGTQEGIPFLSPAGYLHSRLFSSLLPLLVLVFGIGLGARAVGGSEEDGTLELVLAHPVSRARLALERFVAVVGLVVGLTVVGLTALIAAAPVVGLLDGVALVRVTGAGAALMALTLLHASLAFAAGCAFGRRGIASAMAGAVAVAGYLLVGLTAAAETPAALRWLSPWHWYLDRNLLVDAPPATATLLPLSLALALAAAGGWRFVHPDLRLP